MLTESRRSLLRLVKAVLPTSLREAVKQSAFWRRRTNRATGRVLASSSKRLDICAAQLAHQLRLADGRGLEGQTCLELGSGWLLTHSLVFHLLGARRVLAVDVEPLAQPELIRNSVQEALPSHVLEMLSPFADLHVMRERLHRLRSISKFSLEVLAELGVEYQAPVDFAQGGLDRSFDFIYSNSVLEHVPVEDVPRVLSALSQHLSPGGRMLHAVHLEDHLNIRQDPFAFLGLAGADYGRELQTQRGNRIRATGWRRLLDEVEDMTWRTTYEHQRLDAALPARVDSSVEHEGEADLRLSHLGLLGMKAAEA